MTKKQPDKRVKNTLAYAPRHISQSFAIGAKDGKVMRERPGLNFFMMGEEAKPGQVVFLDPKTLKLYLASSAEKVIDLREDDPAP